MSPEDSGDIRSVPSRPPGSPPLPAHAVLQRAVDIRQPEVGRYRELPLVGGSNGLCLRRSRED